MTKVRAPVSIENTLYRVLGQLGIERAAEATGRAESYLRALSDPDKREQLTVRDLVSLDLAWRATGEADPPLYATIGLILDVEGAERFADAAAIGRHAEHTTRESGEACAALIAAALSAGDGDALRLALREAEQAHGAYAATISTIRAQLGRAPDASPAQPP